MIPRSRASEGARHAYMNAQSLYKVATRIRAPELQGLAVSLFILSCEECAKVISLAKHSEGMEDLETLKLVFRRHKAKHEITSDVSTLLHELLIAAGHHKEECKIPQCISTWLSRADEIKQRGLYIDFADNEWKLPKDTSMDDRAFAKLICQTMLAMAKALTLGERAP
ncbi:MAG: AbiV family abortive infection protein [Anaerolineales bacterium]|nr:AbiV family abortive infection protein [Thiobacillus sp.]MDP2994654.1 AbiV family abortive infection protein [Anaerolineales bacterium]